MYVTTTYKTVRGKFSTNVATPWGWIPTRESSAGSLVNQKPFKLQPTKFPIPGKGLGQLILGFRGEAESTPAFLGQRLKLPGPQSQGGRPGEAKSFS